MRPTHGNGNSNGHNNSGNIGQPLQQQQAAAVHQSLSYSLFDPVPPLQPLHGIAATLNGTNITAVPPSATPITSSNSGIANTPAGSFSSFLAFGQPLANAPYFDRSLPQLAVTPSSPGPSPFTSNFTTASTPSSTRSSRPTSPSISIASIASSDDMAASSTTSSIMNGGSRKRSRDPSSMMNDTTNGVDPNGNGVNGDERKRKMSTASAASDISPSNHDMSHEPLSSSAAAWGATNTNNVSSVNDSNSLFAMPFGTTGASGNGVRKLGPSLPPPSSSSEGKGEIQRSDDHIFGQLSSSNNRRSLSTISTATPYSVGGLRINPTPTPRASGNGDGINEDNEVDADIVITAATAIDEEEMKYSEAGAANMVMPNEPSLTARPSAPLPGSTSDASSAAASSSSVNGNGNGNNIGYGFGKSQSQGGATPISRVLSTESNSSIPSPPRSSSTPGLSHPSSSGHSTATPVTSKHSINFTTFELGGKYKVLEYLGSGSYGHVHLAENAAGDKVAIKKIPAIFDNLVNAKRLLREIRILRQLNHPTVIGFRGLLLPDNLDTFDTIYVVFEYVQTDLERLLRSDQNFTTLHIQYFLYQILRGLRYVHAQNVIHRDIKPANLLVNADCSLKICDFGLSRTTNDVYRAPQQPVVQPRAAPKLPDLKPQRFTRQMTKHVVTRWYRAPELILMANDYGPSNSYSAAIDMWACGCILAELLSMQKESHESPDERAALFPGKTCFPLSAENVTAYSDRLDQLNVIFDVIGTPTADEIAAVPSSKARTHLTGLPPKPKVPLATKYAFADTRGVDLLEQLLAFDPAKRITAAAALAHPFMDEVRDRTEEKITLTQLVDPNYFDFEDKPLSRDVLRSLIAEQILLDHPAAQAKYRETHPVRPLAAAAPSISRPPPGFGTATSATAVPSSSSSSSSSSSATAPVPVTRSSSSSSAALAAAAPLSSSSTNAINHGSNISGGGVTGVIGGGDADAVPTAVDENDDIDIDDGYDDDDTHTSEYDDKIHGQVAARKSARSRAPARRAATRGRTTSGKK